MQKYNIAGISVSIEFLDDTTKEIFKPFEVKDKARADYDIVFQKVSYIEKLKETNVENSDGFKSYISDGKQLFDIEDDDHNVVVRGCFEKQLTTFSFIESCEDMGLLEYMLTYMRFCEIASERDVISLQGVVINLGYNSILITSRDEKERAQMVNRWLNLSDNYELLSIDKIFIEKKGNYFVIYPNPWGVIDDVKNEESKLSHIICLEKKRKNKLVFLDYEEKPIELASNLIIKNDDKTEFYLANFCLDLAEYVEVIKFSGVVNDDIVNQIFKKIYFS